MKLKKLLLCVLTLALLTLPVSAHGHHGGCHGQPSVRPSLPSRPAAVTVCQVEGCAIAGRHIHNGVTYCGYPHQNGFCDGRCRALCTVDGCTVEGRHDHNGTLACGYCHLDGFCDGTCRALCTVEGCAIEGFHSHRGTAYCGGRHPSGFCEGICHAA